MTYAVLLDVGGTFLKGAAIKSGADKIGTISRQSGPALVLSRDGSAVLNPAHLQGAVGRLCQEIVDSQNGLPSGIFLTGQMHGLVLTHLDGTPISDVITWRDSMRCAVNGREESAIPIIQSRCSREDLRVFGNELREGLPIATLFSRATLGLKVAGLVPHSIISFCAAGLTGFAEFPLMHETDAAAHGFYDIIRKRWGETALTQLDLEGMVLPRVTDELMPCGYSHNYGCPVYVAVGDQQTSLYGVSLEPGELSLNIATGSQVSAVIADPSFNAQLRPFFQGNYLSTVTHIPAGRALNALMSLVSELSELDNDQLWQLVSEKTINQQQTELRVDLSFFPSATGSSGLISGITETNLEVGHLFRSAVIEMASQYQHFSKLIFPTDDFRNVVVSGGLATRFLPLMQEIKGAFGDRHYRISRSEDASLEGLRRLTEKLDR